MRKRACAWFAESARNSNAALLLFNLETIAGNMRAIATLARKHRAQVLMPVKSFPHASVLGLARSHLQGFDVSNRQELNLAAPRPDQLVVTSGPAPWGGSRRASIAFLDKPEALRQWRASANALSFGIRLDRSDLAPGLPASRFGMGLNEAAALLRALTLLERKAFAGFQAHLGDDEVSERHYLVAVRRMVAFAVEFGLPLRCIDLGGGFRSWSFEKLERTLGRIRSSLPANVQLVLEPGYLLTRNAGYAAGRVLAIHDSTAVTTLSKVAHIRWSDPKLIPRARRLGEKVLIQGPTCFEGDHVGIFREGARFLRPGEVVLFANISGYCVAWNASFNGWPKAHVVFAVRTEFSARNGAQVNSRA